MRRKWWIQKPREMAAPQDGSSSGRRFGTPTPPAAERVVRIVGLDEIDLDRNHISWKSPLARALMKSGPGDRVLLHAPGGTKQLQILEVRYERILWSRSARPLAPRPGPRYVLAQAVSDAPSLWHASDTAGA
jgi:hypothetical protein